MRSSTGRGSRISAALLSLILGARVAFAAPVSPREQALAEALFLEGKRLLLEGKFEAACPKLEESQHIDPAGGTLLMLALCLERQGKLASAWATFSTALSVAQRERVAEREDVAKEHLAALEPRLSRLVLRIAPELRSKAGLVVRWDGVIFAEPSWGLAVPVDPGEHVLEVEWLGDPPLRRHVTIHGEGTLAIVEMVLPVSEPPPAPRPSGEVAVPPPESSSLFVSRGTPFHDPLASKNRARWPGVALLAGGGAALLVGSIAGGVALSRVQAVNRRCPGTQCTDPEARRWNEEARWWADIATISLPLGLIAVGGGGLWLWSSQAPRSGVSAGVRGVF